MAKYKPVEAAIYIIITFFLIFILFDLNVFPIYSDFINITSVCVYMWMYSFPSSVMHVVACCAGVDL